MHHRKTSSFTRLPVAIFFILAIFSYSSLIAASPLPEYSNNEEKSLEVRATIADVPSVAAIQAQLQSHGRVGTDVSLFYTSLKGSSAIQKATAWYACNVQPMTMKPGVAWDGILPNEYLPNIAGQLNNNPVLVDKFLKRTSQAFASSSAGQVFVFYPNGKGDPVDICSTAGRGLNPPGGFSAWCGQEFPALTRNPNVVAIYQVDPDSGTKAGNLIWTPADGPKLVIQDSQVN
ncbi:hypothetical protein F5Y10DRAFT_262934 [Nemania abortiva]|nr:hypothetical protein F5Y10DRAFT_262934 [Nemania abortiva]